MLLKWLLFSYLVNFTRRTVADSEFVGMGMSAYYFPPPTLPFRSLSFSSLPEVPPLFSEGPGTELTENFLKLKMYAREFWRFCCREKHPVCQIKAFACIDWSRARPF
jgi:hypothetical protein